MTVTSDRQNPACAGIELKERVTRRDLAMMTRIVTHRVAPLGLDQAMARRVVEMSVHAFIEQEGEARPAVARVAPLMWEVGEECARHGLEVRALDRHFDLAEKAALEALQFALTRSLPGWRMRTLHREAISFIQSLQRHVWVGWERAQVKLALQETGGNANFGLSSVGSIHRQRVNRIVADVPPENKLRLIRSSAPFAASTLRHPDTLAGPDPRELVIPASWTVDRLGRVCRGQSVVGPTAPPDQIAAHADVIHRAAELLRDGSVTDHRRLVPCMDLLAHLVTVGNHDLTELVVAKHLESIMHLTPRRRVTLGEFLLHWLERGVPTNQLARELGMPLQTAHSRLEQARKIFPNAIDDPMQRIELLVALRTALPRWRAEVSQQ